MNKSKALDNAREWLTKVAGAELRQVDARLYSHQNQVRSDLPGLASWEKKEAKARLKDAVSLIHSGLLLRREGQDGWDVCMRRAAEILEWLSHPSIGSPQVPIRLLAGAAYLLARFPARACSLLEHKEKDTESEIIRLFIKGDFVGALEEVRRFWETIQSQPAQNGSSVSHENIWIIKEVVRCIGIICANIRWGDEKRSKLAIDKLESVSQLLTLELDPYSWLLSRLTTECAREIEIHSWRNILSNLSNNLPSEGREAFERYARLNYLYGHAIAWPSQEDGIARLVEPGGFALCTPTGSGKTSVAEVAILQGIFSDTSFPSLCLYLVPSKALAAEVENKMSRVLRHLAYDQVVVTGLYGGIDWGPTDAWLTTNDPTVLICTYEKGDALIRFLGLLFISRMRLVIFDEAHMVQFSNERIEELRTSESRALRIESLATRIRHMISDGSCRLIALSAVAKGIENTLHVWAGSPENSFPIQTNYRSTRQMIGRLEVSQTGNYTIYYDLLDGSELTSSVGLDTLYVPSAIPKCPPKPSWNGPEKSLRPALLWAGLNFADKDDRGIHRAVLISITQVIEGVAKDFLQLLEKDWKDIELPKVRRPPSNNEELNLWESALAVCEDYFGKESYEYRLLRFGIVLHHGKLPRSLSRLFVELVNRKLANIVLATSTLSEGVNIPVETILLPSLLRYNKPIDVSEFRNLAGRAGRPGVSTEGRVLVLVRSKKTELSSQRYNDLRRSLIKTVEPQTPQSPILSAFSDIWNQWKMRYGTSNQQKFLGWLESITLDKVSQDLVAIDSIDSFFIAGIVELEDVKKSTDWEAALQDLWRGVFSAAQAENILRLAFFTRGVAIPNVYPGRESRRMLYKTGLPVSTASQLLRQLDSIREVLSNGHDYYDWSPELKFEYIYETVKAIFKIGRFAPDQKVKVKDWRSVLQWWLRAPNAETPIANDLTKWHHTANQCFSYRYCWGLGSVIGVSFDQIHSGELLPTSLEKWPETNLPWIVFWLKELVTWGTLDPVAAFLLGRGKVQTRSDAESLSIGYYSSGYVSAFSDPLDPRAVRNWYQDSFPKKVNQTLIQSKTIKVKITDNAVAQSKDRLRVMPIEHDSIVEWIDCAGFVLAISKKNPKVRLSDSVSHKDFFLEPSKSLVTIKNYL